MSESGLHRFLPAELLPELFSSLPFDPEGIQALVQSCRVSRSFSAYAQPSLFAYVDLRKGNNQSSRCVRNIQLFQAALSLNPSLTRHVKSLIFEASSLTQPEFGEDLSSFVNLRSLSIHGRQDRWEVIPNAIQAALLQTVFPRLSSLHLAKFYALPFNDISRALPNMRCLSLDYVSTLNVDDASGLDYSANLGRLRCLTLEGYENSDLKPRYTLRQGLILSPCRLDTLTLKQSTGRDGDIVSFLRLFCQAELGADLRKLYLNVEFYNTIQFTKSSGMPSTSTTFLDLHAVPQLEHLLLEVEDGHVSSPLPVDIWPRLSQFVQSLAEILGYGLQTWHTHLNFRSLTFVNVQSITMLEEASRSSVIQAAWSAFDEILIDRDRLPVFNRVAFGDGFTGLEKIKTLLPQAAYNKLLILGVMIDEIC
ncbi:hypothetical protein DL96DRAFT_1757189 [Flagelloscypha sp. PMI_526]|nr:hypothetical protein DL96DRAFT_1757189 [Flagelloscypha sp. PMI_526]